MIIEVRMDNCLVFSNYCALSMEADMCNKRFGFNVNSTSNFNILKSVAIFGQNNVGKTCAIKCIKFIRQVITNERPLHIMNNFFSKNSISSLGITFLEGKKAYKFDFKYDVKKKEFLYEYFAEIVKDKNGNLREIPYLKRDIVNSEFYFAGDEEGKSLLSNIGRENITIYIIDVDKFKIMHAIKDVLVKFAARIDIINMNNIPLNKTLDIMKNGKRMQKKVVDFIACLGFVDITSIENESAGTKKIVALASYVVDAIENGRVLIVDELDSSLHFTLTRAIVSLFNNEINLDGQLIFTAHDVSLLDCKKLFRKEQIWFIYRDRDNIHTYSLKEFTAREPKGPSLCLKSGTGGRSKCLISQS
jgi:AAA15 family ATPase/GTPase